MKAGTRNIPGKVVESLVLRIHKHRELVEERTIETSQRLRQFIEANLPLAPVAGVPEIRLHQANPTSGLRRLAESDDQFGTPYWAYAWGGGIALARHVFDHPDLVAGRRILDLGSGSGLVGIAAAKSGAIQVSAADVDRYAVAATILNAQANDVSLVPVLGDLTAGLPPPVDMVLVGDLFYAPDLAARVAAFLDRCVLADIIVLIGDPGRAFLPRSRLNLLAEYPGPDFGEGDRPGKPPNAVFSFRAG